PGGSCPIKSFEPGAFGLYDMTGNMWEWTQSRFDPYPSRTTVDPIEKGVMYAYRGGSWSRRFPKWMTTQLRNRYEPDKYSESIGIRCVKPITPTECPPDTTVEDGACVRMKGLPKCEEDFEYSAEKKLCWPTATGRAAHLVRKWPPPDNPAKINAARGRGGALATDDSPLAVSRSRTPQHDADCKRHWPATPASYLFKGGQTYPSRKPAVAAAGCVPRDMTSKWTSACCKR
ncbi:MAG: SUMF1/EgtB/PvdO family nonheme iron enzyme, partial [Myxococcota bacterium]